MNRLCLSVALLVLLGSQQNESMNPSQVSQPDFCFEPPHTGRCRASFTRYYFNSTTGNCQTFVYGGCRGKKNNFVNIEDCMNTCGAK
ncbi:Pancreatic trypsin inhibitor [Tupaia chinensis]|uniref:Pancreatic trypsin inhibitor n=1 Tax=Tupaia chinensis TaxID=246437 RepID=L9KGQ6_TUPCH|nr:Pancreatic trypsin inhibitor [Tupaia chinensis]